MSDCVTLRVENDSGASRPMPIMPIRTFGDPGLRRSARPVAEFDGRLEQLVSEMLETMYDAPGVGLAANQVGLEKALFVYDIGEGPGAICNPELVHSEGRHVRDEGCLSVPGHWFDIERPELAVVNGLDIHGNPIEIAGEGLMARMLVHETDHLNGMLLIDRLEKSARKDAMKAIREGIDAAGGSPIRQPASPGESSRPA